MTNLSFLFVLILVVHIHNDGSDLADVEIPLLLFEPVFCTRLVFTTEVVFVLFSEVQSSFSRKMTAKANNSI